MSGITAAIRNDFNAKKYFFKHWFFKWEMDEEEDVVLRIANVIRLVKYKEHTIIRYRWKKNWGGEYKTAPKYLGAI